MEVRATEYHTASDEVRGSAHITGEHAFILDPRDDLESGFVLR
jgi:proline racemase